MVYESLKIGGSPDFELIFGAIRIPHGLIVDIADNGNDEPARILQNFSLVGLKNSIDEIIRGRTVYGVLFPDPECFATCDVPEKGIVITSNLKFACFISPSQNDNLVNIYKHVFFGA